MTWSRKDQSESILDIYGCILRKRLCLDPLNLKCRSTLSQKPLANTKEPRGKPKKERGVRNPKPGDAWGQGPFIFTSKVSQNVLGHSQLKFPDIQTGNWKEGLSMKFTELKEVACSPCDTAVTSLGNRAFTLDQVFCLRSINPSLKSGNHISRAVFSSCSGSGKLRFLSQHSTRKRSRK